jgi:hypothetical protein
MRKPKRPGFVLFLAICQIVVGGGLICTGGLGVVSSVAGSSATMVTVKKGNETQTIVYDTREEMEREAPGYKTFMLVSAVVGLLLAVMMVVGAIGLIGQKGWGWWLSYGWALLAIAYQASVAVYLWTVAMPACNRVLKAMPRDDAGVVGGLVNGNTFYHFGWAVFASGFALYPLVMVILLALPFVRRSSRPVPDDSIEEEDDRPRRRRPRRDDEYDDGDHDRRPRRRARDDRDG